MNQYETDILNDNSNGILTAECGDLMLAKECVATLRSARFLGDVELDPGKSGVEPVTSGPVGFGTPIGESGFRGFLVGAILGLAALAMVTILVTWWPLSPPAVAVYFVIAGASIGGLIGTVFCYRSLDGRSNTQAVTLRCVGTTDDISHALIALQSAPCRNIRVQVNEPTGPTPTTAA